MKPTKKRGGGEREALISLQKLKVEAIFSFSATRFILKKGFSAFIF